MLDHTGFDQILQALMTDEQRFVVPARETLRRLLTYDGRMPLEYGLLMLTDMERQLYTMGAIADQRLYEHPPAHGDEMVLFEIFYNTLGRLHLRPTDAPKPDYRPYATTMTLGYLLVPAFLLRRAQSEIAAALAREAHLRAHIDALLADMERRGELMALLDQVDDHVRHVESVYFYVDDELWSVIERSRSLIDGGIFDQLRQVKLAHWSAGQRLGVAALRALFLSGRSIRFEEFSGLVLTARQLYSRLQELAAGYEGVCEPVSGDPPHLFDLARAVGQAASQSVGQPWLRYRWNNGLTFFKTERLTSAPRSEEIDQAIGESIVGLYEAWLNRPFDRSLGYQTIFTSLADAALSGAADQQIDLTPQNPARSALEILIQEVVAAALLATRSDYGMSSSLRDPSRLITADPAALRERMLALKPPDFFTCIASRPGLRSVLGESISKDVYGAVQARMEFNRWHFVPGNFLEADVPRSRHYYYPPVTPDLTEWSDQRHGGHIRAGVRYSVRAPGPDMQEPPLVIAGHPYRGFYDIRVVRMEGPPYTLPDLIMTRHHSLWMGVIWRRMIAYSEQHPGAVKISGFVKGEGYEPR